MRGQFALIYPSKDSLAAIRELLDDIGNAVGDVSRRLADTEIPELLGAAGGVGVGAAAGAGILSLGAAPGAFGGAAMTSALAAAGGIVGGGMGAGIAVVAAPAVLLGLGGFWGVSKLNRHRLAVAKLALLQEAILKRDALLKALEQEVEQDKAHLERLEGLLARLMAVIEKLEADLNRDP